ncbi:MAG: GIY-YIG nuclease family protein, partial [Limisphaerales bacterium]
MNITAARRQTIYMAGAMSPNGWRHFLVQGFSDEPIFADEFPVITGAVFGRFDYAGPFPIQVKNDDYNMPDKFEHDDKSWRLRRSAIDKSDVVFGWIEPDEAYATIAELAYAAGNGKLVRYAMSAELGQLGPNGCKRLFPEVLRTFRMFDCGVDLYLSPRMAFAQLFSLPMNIICNVSQQNAVYFIEDSLERIKIGFSKNLKKRVGGFQTGSSIRQRLIGSIPGGKHLESKLHSDFAFLQLEREWFHATQGLRSFIEMELGLRHAQV